MSAYDEITGLRAIDPGEKIAVSERDVESALATWRAHNGLSGASSELLAASLSDDEMTDHWTIRSTSSARNPSRRPVWAASALLGAAAITAVVSFAALNHGTVPNAESAATSDPVTSQTPLLVGASIDCDGVAVPISALAAPVGAETAQTAAGDALRNFFKNNPWEGQTDVPRTGWALLRQTPEQMVFGQRTGPLGVTNTILLEQQPGGFVATQLGNCYGITLPNGDRTSTITAVSEIGNQLIVTWVTSESTCVNTPMSLADLRVAETPTSVHLLAVVTPPMKGDLAPYCIAQPSERAVATTRITLTTPLNGRLLSDDGTVPATILSVTQ